MCLHSMLPFKSIDSATFANLFDCHVKLDKAVITQKENYLFSKARYLSNLCVNKLYDDNDVNIITCKYYTVDEFNNASTKLVSPPIFFV